MASEAALRQADLHRNAMKALTMSPTLGNEIRQVANAVLDNMLWLDNNYTDLKTLFESVSQLESSLEIANNRIRQLETMIRSVD